MVRLARGKLQSMKSTGGFRDFVLEQLSGVPKLHDRAMFGGIGLYSDDVFFGLIAADVLYLKTDDSNRAAFEKLGAGPFRPYPDRPMTMPYYSVPARILEDPDELVIWARRSVAIATAGKKKIR